MVFNGTIGAPPDNFGPGRISPYVPPGDITTVPFAPAVREAPFVYYGGGQFRVFRPSVQFNVRGPNWSTDAWQGDSLSLSSFYVATVAAGDNAETMNAALKNGKNLLIGPGTYVLDEPITVSQPNRVIMGLGDPILRADNTATIFVKDSATGTLTFQIQRGRPRLHPSGMGPFADNQIVIGSTPHGSGSAHRPDGAERHQHSQRSDKRDPAQEELHDPEPGPDPDQ